MSENLLFFKLNTSYLPKLIQIKIRYNPNHSDAFCIRLFKVVPFSVIMISVTCSHKKQEPPLPKFGACFACTVDSTLQKSCFTHIYEKLLHTHLRKVASHTPMITLNTDINNTLTQKIYNQLIADLQFHQLTCTCGRSGSLSVHAYYMRSLKVPEGKLRLRICRVICSCCGRTHALLPSFIVPYSQIPLQEQVEIISAYETSDSSQSVMNRIPSIDESNCAYVIRQYCRHWKQRLLSERIDICETSLVSRCFSAFLRQFMQIKSTPNILFFNTT